MLFGGLPHLDPGRQHVITPARKKEQKSGERACNRTYVRIEYLAE